MLSRWSESMEYVRYSNYIRKKFLNNLEIYGFWAFDSWYDHCYPLLWGLKLVQTHYTHPIIYRVRRRQSKKNPNHNTLQLNRLKVFGSIYLMLSLGLVHSSVFERYDWMSHRDSCFENDLETALIAKWFLNSSFILDVLD